MVPVVIERLTQMISRYGYGISDLDTPDSEDFDTEV